MKIGIVGSRNITYVDLARFIPPQCTEIVSGGARGVDSCAAKFAREHGIKLTEFLPEYHVYGRGAPLMRNTQIVEYADMVLAFWDGTSRGTRDTIHKCRSLHKPIRIFRFVLKK